jgi:polar amino acid transport system substrate-binding protein
MPGLDSAPASVPRAVIETIAPSGILRVGVVPAPTRSAFFVVADAHGKPSGVTVDLGREFARHLGIPAEIVVVPNGGALVDALCSGSVDVAFMPTDDERRKKVAFGSEYFIIESTYLVAPGSDIKTLDDVDHTATKVVGLAGTATIRCAGNLLKNAAITAAKSVTEAMAMLKGGKADALALTRDVLTQLATQVPGSRILNDSFMQTSVTIAVPKSRLAALALATEFMENAKASGFIQVAFDNAGLDRLIVAPMGR